MARYVIRHIRAGDDVITDALFEGTKAQARREARALADYLYPDASIRWSGDARVIYQDGLFVGSVGVEPGAAWRADPS